MTTVIYWRTKNMTYPDNKIVKTRNIQDSLETYAKENSIALQECDFAIKSVSTYIKTNSDDEFKLFNENINEHYKDKDSIINNHVEFQQLYTINIYQIDERELILNYTIEHDQFYCVPKIVISPDSTIPYKTKKPKEIFISIIQEINKIKVKNSILINIFDEKMIKNIKAFIKYLYQGKFKKKIRLPLFEGIEPEIAKAGKLIFWFQHKNFDKKLQIIEVEKDEILVEYKKPIYGASGFNSYGQQIDKQYTHNADDLQTSIDNSSIYIEENEEKKLYKSKVKGFVHFTKALLSVNNKVKMSKLSRVDGSIAEEEENNIEVHISQNDTTKDSVGEGVELVSETIHINGHVGAKSTLEAVNLQIDGATHQDSMQFAKTAKINRHKGTLRCADAKINLLEGGTVHATNLEVEASLGGTIYAQNVKIGHAKSNLKVYASESIEIRLVSGEDNLFKINYKDIPILTSKIDFIKEDISDLRFALEEAHRHNKPNIKELQKKVIQLKSKIQDIENSVFKAKVTIEKPLRGLNIINFTLKDTEIIYKTDAQAYSTFYLEVNENKITLHPVNKTITID